MGLAAASLQRRIHSGEFCSSMRRVFSLKRTLASTNPDDIALLQELSKKDAELHVAYSAHLYSQGKLPEAARQWESGCVRLETCAYCSPQHIHQQPPD